jgi:hypothetical protein
MKRGFRSCYKDQRYPIRIMPFLHLPMHKMRFEESDMHCPMQSRPEPFWEPGVRMQGCGMRHENVSLRLSQVSNAGRKSVQAPVSVVVVVARSPVLVVSVCKDVELWDLASYEVCLCE